MKFLHKSLLAAAMAVCALGASAQGTWKATGTEPAIAASTETGFGIPSLTAMHSDNVIAVVGKTDTGAPADGIFTNEAFIQGGTNAMYFAFKPTISGVLGVAAKWGGAKLTSVVEVVGETDLAVVTATLDVRALTGNFPLCTMTDGSTATFDGTIAVNPTAGTNIYTTVSFPVTAGKIYAVGVAGSKIMMRGVDLKASSSIGDIVEGSPVVSEEYFNLTGAKVAGPVSGTVTIVKQTLANGKVVTSKEYVK